MNVVAYPDQKQSIDIRLSELARQYALVRQQTLDLCASLEPEDYVIQSMPDTSPTKWHLAHTTWFFETFLLAEGQADYQPFHPDFAYLFNSYYVQAGKRWQRPHRGLLSRPTVNEVQQYRHHVDAAMNHFFEVTIPSMSDAEADSYLTRIEIGLNHEQQHQELLVTDIKHAFSINPLKPAFHPDPAGQKNASAAGDIPPAEWVEFEESIAEIGYGGTKFFYDNEMPKHRQLVPAFELMNRTVTCAEYLQFMEDGGYSRPELWLSLGWAAVEAHEWEAPLYWESADNGDTDWRMFTAGGMRDLDFNEPVTHVSFFEADAYARWKGLDLPTEAMWESACRQSGCTAESGNFVESGLFHPVTSKGDGLLQMLGNTWEWTSSPYTAYPGYRAPSGALGEYNGKFMCNQMVLRGGSCATPQSHIRMTYRNFFPPDARWQFSGIRLSRLVNNGS